MGNDLFSDLKAKYTSRHEAEALFINTNQKALRVECTDLALEFTDGVYIGKDPEGELFYNHKNDLTGPSTFYYYAERLINPFDKKVLAHIIFYTSSKNQPVAEFLGEDPTEALMGASMDKYSHSGRWQTLAVMKVSATITKGAGSTTLNISVPTVGKSATVTVSGTLQNRSIDVNGTMHIKNLSTFTSGVYASYNDDRIIFYQSSYSSTDFTAYFIPSDASATNLGVTSNSTTELNPVSWR